MNKLSALFSFPLTLFASIFLAVTAVITFTLTAAALVLRTCLTLTYKFLVLLTEYLSTLLPSSSTASAPEHIYSPGFASIANSRSFDDSQLLHSYYPNPDQHHSSANHSPSPHRSRRRRHSTYGHRNSEDSDTPRDSASHAIPGILGVIHGQLPPNTYESSRRDFLDSNINLNGTSGEWGDIPENTNIPAYRNIGRRCSSPSPSNFDVHQYDSDKGGLLPLGPYIERPARPQRHRSTVRGNQRYRDVEFQFHGSGWLVG